MIIKEVCKYAGNRTCFPPYIGLDEKGCLWLAAEDCQQEKKWKAIDFNNLYKGYYPMCSFTAIGATDKDFVAAGVGEDGLPCVFRSLLGGVWENVNLLCGNQLAGYQRASGKIIDILYDCITKQLFMPCENGELLIIPDCPKCAKIYRVSEERIVGGHFSEDGRNIVLITAAGNEVEIKKDEASQLRVTSDYAEKRIKEGGILVDLRKMDEDDVGEWLQSQPKSRFIAFLCYYGVQSDRAAKYARSKGYYQAYSLGGERLKQWE